MPGRIEARIENLHKSFGDQHVLRGVNLDVREGEILCVVGGSGCGKTVLVSHIERIHTPDAGRVLVRDDRLTPDSLSESDRGSIDKRGAIIDNDVFWDIAKLSDNEMNRFRLRWSFVFQRNALFSGTVYDNVSLWLREHTKKKEKEIHEIVRTALESVSFSFDEVANKHRDELSGGMAKRVALARAVATNPDIVFYDEPTTGLDPAHASEIHELIFKVQEREREDSRNNTTVIITHDKELLHRFRPRVAMLHEGKVFFDGAYDDFEKSTSSIIRPYFETMQTLQQRVRT